MIVLDFKDQQTDLHFGMVDSGAMVGAIHHCMLEWFPYLKEYFIAEEEHLIGVGGVVCHVFGELHNVPICIGSAQNSYGLYNCNFKVSMG